MYVGPAAISVIFVNLALSALPWQVLSQGGIIPYQNDLPGLRLSRCISVVGKGPTFVRIKTQSCRICSHDKTLDVMLLGNGDEFVHDAANEVLPGDLGQGVMPFLRDHHVVQFGVAGARRVDPQNHDRPGDR